MGERPDRADIGTVVWIGAAGEMDVHLGYAKHEPAGRDGGNSRNGARAKTVLTNIGPAEVTIPRDRDAMFEPQIVRKRQRRLSGLDGLAISSSAKGLTHGCGGVHRRHQRQDPGGQRREQADLRRARVAQAIT